MTGKTSYPRKRPLRSCIACRMTADKRTLTRFVRTAEGQAVCDPTGKLAGRGAYLCEEKSCFERAQKGHLFDRALRMRLDETDYERLKKEFTVLAFERDLVEEQ